uniref:Ubiquinol-cytochrome c chaperone domain-containing protein n=1 Tax=Globodera rostochiensis TaxID=31243 RepID=A0A914HT34_GLORO
MNSDDYENNKMASAQQQFEAILASFSDDAEQRAQFIDWLRHRVPCQNGAAPVKQFNLARKQLGRIAKRLRELTPLEYCLDLPGVQQCSSPAAAAPPPPPNSVPTKQQHMVWPVTGAFAECKPHNTLHVDAFLFDDNDVDEMAKDGILRRYFCQNCHSTDVEQFTLISHSLAIDELHHLFTVHLPSLDGKVLVDIGSRLGAVLYAAALYCPRIGRAVGIEREQFFHELHYGVPMFGISGQKTTPRAVKADVVTMHNVFTFFADHAEQISCWQHLHAQLRPGTLLVHSPSLESVTAHLCPTALGFAFGDWLQTLHIGTAAEGDTLMFCSTTQRIVPLSHRCLATKVVRFPLVQPPGHSSSVQTLQQLIASQPNPSSFVFGSNMTGRVGQWLTKRSFEKAMDDELRILLLKSATQMYNDCANKFPFLALLNEFGLPDHYSSWYRLTLLHTWMALCRVQQSLEAMSYIYFMHQVLTVFNADWYSRMDKAKTDLGLVLNKHKEGMVLHAIYMSTLHDYDEGFFGDDCLLAAAVWRSFYLQMDDTSPAQINRVVRYIRATIGPIESSARLDDKRLLTDGIERWHVAEELARLLTAAHFGTNEPPPPSASSSPQAPQTMTAK